jgi:hypothetical protein
MSALVGSGYVAAAAGTSRLILSTQHPSHNPPSDAQHGSRIPSTGKAEQDQLATARGNDGDDGDECDARRWLPAYLRWGRGEKTNGNFPPSPPSF